MLHRIRERTVSDVHGVISCGAPCMPYLPFGGLSGQLQGVPPLFSGSRIYGKSVLECCLGVNADAIWPD